jgi:hypothetical protein
LRFKEEKEEKNIKSLEKEKEEYDCEVILM